MWELEREGDRPGRGAEDSRLRRRHVMLFVSYLHELPLVAWMNATRQRKHHPKYNVAIRSLDVALQGLGDSEMVFTTRDAVLSQLQRFDGEEGRTAGLDRQWTQGLRSQTERAALGVLARDKLSAEDFAQLYAPFESLIPPALLFGIEGQRQSSSRRDGGRAARAFPSSLALRWAVH